MKLYLKSLKNGGRLQLDEHIPYTAQMIATLTRHQIGTVERALAIFQQLGLVEQLDCGLLYMTDIELMIGQSSTDPKKKKGEQMGDTAPKKERIKNSRKNDRNEKELRPQTNLPETEGKEGGKKGRVRAGSAPGRAGRKDKLPRADSPQNGRQSDPEKGPPNEHPQIQPKGGGGLKKNLWPDQLGGGEGGERGKRDFLTPREKGEIFSKFVQRKRRERGERERERKGGGGEHPPRSFGNGKKIM